VSDVASLLAGVVGPDNVLTEGAALADYGHDEALSVTPGQPAFVVKPGTTSEVAGVLRIASEYKLAVTARGSGTGLSGGTIPRPGGLVMSFARMNQILEIDTANHVAVVQPGVTLADLEAASAEHGLSYPVYPGEMSASLGGTIATNAGGMRAVKYGVTRRHVLGLEAVLASGEVLRTGGKPVKLSSGYDLTQLIIGSEGTLALVTEATLRLYPRLPAQAVLLAPFGSLTKVTTAVPRILASGVGPLMLEYMDARSMAMILQGENTDVGIPDSVRETTQAYLMVVHEERDSGRLDADVADLAELLADAGATDVYALPRAAGRRIIEARERAFWAVKRSGADDILDTVVPRAAMVTFLGEVEKIAARHQRMVIGTGHAGDGNVHLVVFEPDEVARGQLMREIVAAAKASGGAVSGEHGIGTAKVKHFLEQADPVALSLMRQVKKAFDPDGILNPGVLFG
jgi:glycolate oxidase